MAMKIASTKKEKPSAKKATARRVDGDPGPVEVAVIAQPRPGAGELAQQQRGGGARVSVGADQRSGPGTEPVGGCRDHARVLAHEHGAPAHRQLGRVADELARGEMQRLARLRPDPER